MNPIECTIWRLQEVVAQEICGGSRHWRSQRSLTSYYVLCLSDGGNGRQSYGVSKFAAGGIIAGTCLWNSAVAEPIEAVGAFAVEGSFAGPEFYG